MSKSDELTGRIVSRRQKRRETAIFRLIGLGIMLVSVLVMMILSLIRGCAGA